MFWVLGLYIYRRVGFFLLLGPFVALVRPPDVEVLTFLSSNFTIFLGSCGYLGIVPMVLWREHCSWCLLTFRGCGSVQGVELRGVVVTILSLQFWNTWVRRHRKSLLCSCWWDNLDATQYWAGVREYCHNSYNGCFSKVEVNDLRRFLGYVLKDGYNWM